MTGHGFRGALDPFHFVGSTRRRIAEHSGKSELLGAYHCVGFRYAARQECAEACRCHRDCSIRPMLLVDVPADPTYYFGTSEPGRECLVALISGSRFREKLSKFVSRRLCPCCDAGRCACDGREKKSAFRLGGAVRQSFKRGYVWSPETVRPATTTRERLMHSDPRLEAGPQHDQRHQRPPGDRIEKRDVGHRTPHEHPEECGSSPVATRPAPRWSANRGDDQAGPEIGPTTRPLTIHDHWPPWQQRRRVNNTGQCLQPIELPQRSTNATEATRMRSIRTGDGGRRISRGCERESSSAAASSIANLGLRTT